MGRYLLHGCFISIFWSAVFGENARYCYSLCVVIVGGVVVCGSVVGGCVVGGMQKLTFCDISIISEDICLKLGDCIYYPKSNPYYQGKQFIMLFLFRIMPFFMPQYRKIGAYCSNSVRLSVRLSVCTNLT